MATVDPKAPARASYPSRRKYARNGAVARSAVRNPGTTITTRPCPRGAATGLHDRHARRAGSRRARISPNDEAAGGPWAVREFDSRKRDRCFLRLMLFGVVPGCPGAMEVRLMACSAARWLRRNGPVALARRPWEHRCRCSTRRPAAVARPRIAPLKGSGVRRRGCRRRRSATRR
jgi:hypothetical protein